MSPRGHVWGAGRVTTRRTRQLHVGGWRWVGTATPRVSESFKCPLQSFVNDPIHSPLTSFVSAIKKCLPRAILHFLLLFCVFFKRRRKKKSWRRDALTWVKVSRELRISKKQIFSKLLPRMSQCDLFIIFFKKRALGKRKSGEYLKPEAFTALNGVSAGRVMALLESFPCALRSPYLTFSSVRGFLHVRYSYIL